MRVAVVSDIHANLTALEAVIADLRTVSPDLVVHGGDLVGGGSRPAAVIDRIRDLGWPGVYGNADEMLWEPQRVRDMLQAPHLQRIRDLLLTHSIPAVRSAIGDDRLAWLRALPLVWSGSDVAVVHAAPDSAWTGLAPTAADDEWPRVYGTLDASTVIYGHIHVPFVRRLPAMTVTNSGAVSLSYDGDPRAAYAIVEEGDVVIRRVEYDIEAEIRLLLASDDPFATSSAATLRTGQYAPLSGN
jgi:putative phosphoesterase